MKAQPTTVHKLDAQGRFILAYEGTLSERFADGVSIEAQWTRKPLSLGYTTFETCDHFIEWYYADRWYNINEIHDGRTGTLKGWYCNVSSPAEIETTPTGDLLISYRDLYLDVWVTPDGATRTLDEDEFADAELDDATREAAHAGLAELLVLVEQRAAPFDSIR